LGGLLRLSAHRLALLLQALPLGGDFLVQALAFDVAFLLQALPLGVDLSLRALNGGLDLVLGAAPLGLRLECGRSLRGGSRVLETLGELRLQLLLVLLPLDRGGLGGALFGVGPRGDDQLLELALPLGAGLVEFGARQLELALEVALRLHGGLATRLVDRQLVLLF
jgi:hypothetical protein